MERCVKFIRVKWYNTRKCREKNWYGEMGKVEEIGELCIRSFHFAVPA